VSHSLNQGDPYKNPSLKEIDSFTGVLLGLAYTDRLAKRRNPQSRRYHLVQGPGAVLLNDDAQTPSDFLAIGDLRKKKHESPIYLSAPLSLTQIREFFIGHIIKEKDISWNAKEHTIDAFEYEKLGAITLKRYFLKNIRTEDRKKVLIEALRKDLSLLPWDDSHRQWQERIMCVKEWFPQMKWPDVDDQRLRKKFDQWLLPFLDSLQSEEDLKKIDLQAALDFFLGKELQDTLDELAPAFFLAPTGGQVRIRYEKGKDPFLPIKINEMYGQRETPSIAEGKIPLLLHLLNPAGRPVQITGRLEEFWEGSYKQVRKELNRQYPKHNWPLDPLNQIPSRYSKQKKRKRS
jgi:ATP-dependent helicase HrpB